MPYDFFGDLQLSVGYWAERTFPQATNTSIIAHLRREVAELAEADENLQPLEEEIADCLLLLMHLAHRRGFGLEHLAREKYTINRNRTWSTPDHEGVVEHLR